MGKPFFGQHVAEIHKSRHRAGLMKFIEMR